MFVFDTWYVRFLMFDTHHYPSLARVVGGGRYHFLRSGVAELTGITYKCMCVCVSFCVRVSE